MTNVMHKAELGRMLAEAAAAVRNQHHLLTELDSIGGDGDHGTTMLRAAEQWEAQPERWLSSETLNQLLQATGWRVLGVDGGASSSLLGTFFAGMGDVTLPPDALTCRDLAEALQAGLRAVSRQTKARPGDKTMMDALVPAVDAVSLAAAAGKTIPDALEEGAQAAERGATATADLVARYGRARSMGERTRGHPDPGATSIALIFRGFTEACRKED